MPKNKVKTIPVDHYVFMLIIKKKQSSIRKLGSLTVKEVECTEKTIRRAFEIDPATGKERGMREKYIKQIAKYLNVDSRLLTGELVRKGLTEKDPVRKRMYLSPLNHIEKYPYFKEEQRELHKPKENGPFKTGGIKETIQRILALFDTSYSQFEGMSFDEQYHFQYDLFDAMLPVIYRCFKKNAYGETGITSFSRIINDLEDCKEDHDELEYADTVLRQQYLNNPPKGLTYKKIEKMPASELLDFAINQFMEYPSNDFFEEKYKDIPTI